jgi:ATP-dependent DNA ligase
LAVIHAPIEPMLAKLLDSIPATGGLLFEPKWDGFRSIVFRSNDDVYIQSRDLKPLDRYFPELHQALLERLPPGCVIDGEIVIAMEGSLNFDALQLRLHPAASRVAKLSKEMPSSFVGFDLLAVDGASIMDRPQSERRAALETLLALVEPPVYLTPMTRDRKVATEWLQRFEGAGLDGVIAKPEDATYQPGKRAMFKIKHARTADCVVAGFRWHKKAADSIGSLLLGLFDDNGRLHHVGVTSSFTMEKRKQLVEELEPLRKDAMASHPWREWVAFAEASAPKVEASLREDASARQAVTTTPEEMAKVGQRMPGGHSRWSAGKDLSWEPLRIERVCEVKYDHMQGDRFRHAATFLRWREDKAPKDCRYDQLEVTPAYELASVFGAIRQDSR